MDFPEDPRTWSIDNQFLVGESLLVAPAFTGEPSRSVYLPEGEWFDYWTGKRYTGKQQIHLEVPLEQIPIFVRSGTLLPLAEPALHTDDPASWRLTVNIYGDQPVPATLYEDDGTSAPTLAEVQFNWDADRKTGTMKRAGIGRYEVLKWIPIS
jgi:alpha-D-xyloside xylohydrolase